MSTINTENQGGGITQEILPRSEGLLVSWHHTRSSNRLQNTMFEEVYSSHSVSEIIQHVGGGGVAAGLGGGREASGSPEEDCCC